MKKHYPNCSIYWSSTFDKMFALLESANFDFKIQKNIWTMGNVELLESFPNTWALFCSSRCPGSIILKAYDLAQKWAEKNITVISGFHSAVEKEILQVLLSGKADVVVCPARSLSGMRIPAIWREPIDQGRLLLVSPLAAKYKRPMAELTLQRNMFAAALAEKILFLHATPGGKLENFVVKVLNWNKDVYCLDDPANKNLIQAGIKILQKGK